MVPNLRFTNNQLKDFKIVDICKLKQGNQYDLKQQFTEEKSDLKRFIRIVDYTQKTNDIRYVYSNGSENYVDCTDVVVVRYGASAGYVGRGINGIIANNLFTIRPINSALLNKSYLYHYLNAPVIQKQLNNTQSSGMPALNFQTINNLHILLPEYQEQRQIAVFLDKIDERIQTQIKIIDDCISYRNAIVDYYFESLSGNWKKVKLSNILKEYSELHIKDDSIVHATLSKEGIFPKTDRYDRDFLVKDEDKKYKVTHLNDICYNPANLKFGVITRNTFGDCIISPIYITFKIKSGFIPKFVELLVTRKQFISKARKYEQGTVYERMSVNSSDLLSMYVLIPSFSIQQKIVNIINNIDNKIFNEQKLLNLYKLQKVYLLKNMFI